MGAGSATGTLEAAAVKRRSSPLARVAQWSAYAGLVWGAAAFGAVYPWAYWPLAAICAVSGVAGLRARRTTTLSADERGLSWALCGIACAVAVQLVPLPNSVLERLGVHRIEVLKQLDVAYALGATSHPISIDRVATITSLALLGSFGVMLIGLMHALSIRRSLRMLRAITLIGLALAIVAVIQRSVSPGPLVYGFWQPRMDARPFGPFINKNHFAGWMLMAIPALLGYLCSMIGRGVDTVRPTAHGWLMWLSSPDGGQAVQAAFAVVVMGVALTLSLSRSGVVSLATALLAGGVAAIRRQRSALGRAGIVIGLVSCITLTVVWAGSETIAARFAASDTVGFSGRQAIWRVASDMLGDFWLAGSGLNTFGVASLFYPDAIPGFHLREAHNDYLQLAIEGGVLVGVPIAIAVVTLVVFARRRLGESEGPEYWLRLGAVTGIGAMAIQSLVEFSLQMPGNAALFVTLCAIALHRPPTPERRASSIVSA